MRDQSNAIREQVSFKKREDHIRQTWMFLCKHYKLNKSDLVKFLIKKEEYFLRKPEGVLSGIVHDCDVTPFIGPGSTSFPNRFHSDHALWSGWSQTFKTGLLSRSQQRGGNTPLFYVCKPFSSNRSPQRFINSIRSSRNCALSYA